MNSSYYVITKNKYYSVGAIGPFDLVFDRKTFDEKNYLNSKVKELRYCTNKDTGVIIKKLTETEIDFIITKFQTEKLKELNSLTKEKLDLLIHDQTKLPTLQAVTLTKVTDNAKYNEIKKPSEKLNYGYRREVLSLSQCIHYNRSYSHSSVSITERWFPNLVQSNIFKKLISNSDIYYQYKDNEFENINDILLSTNDTKTKYIFPIPSIVKDCIRPNVKIMSILNNGHSYKKTNEIELVGV